jgi:hypothetical protein
MISFPKLGKLLNFFGVILIILSSVFSISGCVYITHLDKTLFLKSISDNQNAMQAQLDKEERLFNKLKADIDNGRLAKAMPRGKIFQLYGEPALCRDVQGPGSIKETCIYRKPGGLSSPIILLNLDEQERLFSWEIQNPDK